MDSNLAVVLVVVCACAVFSMAAACWAVAWFGRRQGEQFCRIVAQSDEKVKAEARQKQKLENMFMTMCNAQGYVTYRQMAGNLAEYTEEPVPDHATSPPVFPNGKMIPQDAEQAMKVYSHLQEKMAQKQAEASFAVSDPMRDSLE